MCAIIFLCMYILFTHYLLIVLLSLFGYCEQCFYEQGNSNISWRSCFQFLWYYIPRTGIAGSCSNSIFIFLRNYHTVFHSSYTILLPHEPHKLSIFSTSSPILFFLLLFYSHHSNGYEVVPYGLNL